MATQTLGSLSCVVILTLISGNLGSCPVGKFGWRCNVDCRCRSDSTAGCDPVTGQCVDGCDPDHYGPHCLFGKECYYDPVGQMYMGTMSTSKGDHPCKAWDLAGKEFPPGDSPKNYCRNPRLEGRLGLASQPWCHLDLPHNVSHPAHRATQACALRRCECPSYLFGENCTHQCHCRNTSELCDVRSGSCQSGCAPGWIGSNCQKRCDKGWYGPGCGQTCGNCYQDDCDPETGRCVSGCRAGFSGQDCTEGCQAMRYGRDCQHTCGSCFQGEACDGVTGVCGMGCGPGYDRADRTCSTPCGRMTYGDHCTERCGYCREGQSCHHQTGVCPHGCTAGYHGELCTQVCQDHYFGEGCRQKCGYCRDNSTCDKASGNCLYGCSDGYSGNDCRTALMTSAEASVKLGIGAGVAAFIVVILLILILILVFRRRRNKKMNVSRSYVEEAKDDGCGPALNTEHCMLLGDSRVEQTQIPEVEETACRPDEVSEPIYMNVNGRKQTAPVSLGDLHAYILKNKDNNSDGFRKEFEELPMGLLALCEVARRPENKAKNRYGNIIAYDHSRVVLEPLMNESHSDYVNASFMDGYHRPRVFIASQGPNKMMIRDFWRMVWQHRVSKVVMLTNLVEACKKKCEQYWPDEGTIKYGDVSVRIVDTAKYTDFIIRTFEISKDDNSRIVKQFHFCTWSDHGAPTYPTTLLAFRRKVQSFNPDNTAPILCHCSAGIGRTGTYIGLHYLLDQANSEGQVDVLQAAHIMRSNRVNMIQTCEQYIFVYDALLEALQARDTTIARSSFRATFEEMTHNDNGTETPLEKQYDTLQLLSPTIDRSECTAALSEENMNKNRFKNVLPANRSRPFLYTPIDDCNDYINAVFLSGYTQKDRFLVTQMPLPHTVADFWRMLYDYNSDAIVMLNEFDRNDKSCSLYWPEEYGYTEEHGPLSVELLSSSDVDADVTIRIFKLSHHGRGEERAVKQFMFKSWPDYQALPNSVTSMLRLHRMVTDWYKQNGKGPVTIHCMNGASKSGILAAVCLILERLELDLEVDVYQAVKQIRINRPQFIESLEQYQFLYQMVLEYLDSQE